METKQVIVLRKDLNMRKGKMVAQGSHASLGAIFNYMKQVGFSGAEGDGSGLYHLNAPAEMVHWLSSSFRKICVSVNSEEELLAVYEKAKAAGLPCSLITDKGHTEFHGVPTKTAVAVGPAEESKVNAITGNLQLL